MSNEGRSEANETARLDGGTGLIAISRGGAELAGKLAAALPDQLSLQVVERYSDAATLPSYLAVKTFSLPLRPVIEEAFYAYSRLVLFMPVGAAVRMLAPVLQHKHRDPAVVCVDDAGRFVVSLLSGHVGGADELAEQVSDILGATAVITSASHVQDTLAVDLLGREFGWQVDSDSATVTRVSAAVVNGDPVGVFQESGERDWWPAGKDLPGNICQFSTFEDLLASDCVAAIVISDWEGDYGTTADVRADSVSKSLPMVVIRPRSLVVGMGCRRGVERGHLEELLMATFRENGLSLKSIKCIATADIKSDEAGIIELADKYHAPVVCFGAEELNSMFAGVTETAGPEGRQAETGEGKGPTPSAAAYRLLGVWGVSEPAALLASGSGGLLVSRRKTDRATISVARVPFGKE